MAHTQTDQTVIDAYRDWLEAALASEERLGPPERIDRPDGSNLATRFAIAPSVWVELAIRPVAGQLQASVLTDDRWISEEMEEAIQDSGDTMQEFVEMGFEDAGLEWIDPPVMHYREAGKLFYFSTPLDIQSLADLNDDALRTKTRQMVQGYCNAFSPVLAAKD
ncbi:MAG: hypothetical protein ACE5GE_15755 [Phycisphaerae bacterium]